MFFIPGELEQILKIMGQGATIIHPPRRSLWWLLLAIPLAVTGFAWLLRRWTAVEWREPVETVSVPDAGGTLVMLGIALVVLFVMRRRR